MRSWFSGLSETGGCLIRLFNGKKWWRTKNHPILGYHMLRQTLNSETKKHRSNVDGRNIQLRRTTFFAYRNPHGPHEKIIQAMPLMLLYQHKPQQNISSTSPLHFYFQNTYGFLWGSEGYNTPSHVQLGNLMIDKWICCWINHDKPICAMVKRW